MLDAQERPPDQSQGSNLTPQSALSPERDSLVKILQVHRKGAGNCQRTNVKINREPSNTQQLIEII
jgi:hypothetical protein